MDEFLPATQLNRAQRRRSAAISKGKHIVNNQYVAEDHLLKGLTSFDVSEEHLTRRLESALSNLREDDYFKSFCKVLDTALLDLNLSIDQIVCYGLGTFGSTLTARYQLGFLVLLQQKLSASVEIYDPTFTKNEIKVMDTKLGFNVLVNNEEGFRVVDTPTLFYMPHAPHQLVNNLLYANWTSCSLTKVICLCNSFSNLKVNFPLQVLQNDLQYIDRTEKIVREYCINNSFSNKDIFNDTALHTFPLRMVNDLPAPNDFWKKSSKPTYQQLEFIPASTGHSDDAIEAT